MSFNFVLSSQNKKEDGTDNPIFFVGIRSCDLLIHHRTLTLPEKRNVLHKDSIADISEKCKKNVHIFQSSSFWVGVAFKGIEFSPKNLSKNQKGERMHEF